MTRVFDLIAAVISTNPRDAKKPDHSGCYKTVMADHASARGFAERVF